MAKARYTKYDGVKVCAIDNMPVIFLYTLNCKDFPNLTISESMRLRVPYEFAICKTDKPGSGVVIYGRYSSEWYEVKNFSDFLIQVILRKQLEQDFQYSY